MTFLELMVVMVILGVLLSVSVPRMAALGRLGQLRSAARDIVALTRYARSTAVFGEIEVELRIQPEEGRYELEYDAVALELREGDRRESRGQSRRSGRPRHGRRMEDQIERRHALWRNFRSLPTNRMGEPSVRFAAVETELEVASQLNRHTNLPVVVFFPDGTASGGLIVLEGVSGARLTIEILTATGAVVVHEGDAREEMDEEALVS